MPFYDASQTAAWNALTNTPRLVSGVGEPGTRYQVSVSGTTTLDGVSSWAAGDIVEFMNYTRTWVKTYNTVTGNPGVVPDNVYNQITVTNTGTDWALTDGVYSSITVTDDGQSWDVTDGIYGNVTVTQNGTFWNAANLQRDFKESVLVATTANITLSGEQTIDGVLTSASRVLVKNQSTGSQNGIYVSAAGAWARSDDADISAEVTSGLVVNVESGSANADTVYQLITSDPITLGTTALVFQALLIPTTFPITTTNSTTSITVNNAALVNRWVQLTSNSNVTVTLAASNSTPVNTEIYFQKNGTGLVTFAASGTTIVAPFGLNIAQRYAYALAKKTGTTTWTVIVYDESTRIPQRISNADTTLTLADIGCHIYRAVGETTARTWTIPANSSVAFPIGSVVSFINDGTSGNVTIAITTDTLVLSGAGTTGSRTLAVYGQATATKVTATRWYIIGTGLS